jgi:hypothetical protein
MIMNHIGSPFSIGDVWCVAAAFASALFILRLEFISNRVNAAELNAVSFSTVTILCGLWVTGDAYLKGTLQSFDIIKTVQDFESFLASSDLDTSFGILFPVLYLGM